MKKPAVNYYNRFKNDIKIRYFSTLKAFTPGK